MHDSYLIEFDNQNDIENEIIEPKHILNIADHQSYLLELPSNSNILTDSNQQNIIPNAIKELDDDDNKLERKL